MSKNSNKKSAEGGPGLDKMTSAVSANSSGSSDKPVGVAGVRGDTPNDSSNTNTINYAL